MGLITIRKRTVRRVVGLLLLVMVSPCCYYCLLLSAFAVSIPAIPIHDAMTYPDAQFIYRGAPACGSSEIWPSYNYYWTQDNLETVRKHYEQSLPPFVSHKDAAGTWLTTEFEPPFFSFFVNRLAEFDAEFTYFSRSANVVLASLSQGSLSQIRALLPECMSSYSGGAVYSFLESPPSSGTLIIYSYDVWSP